MPKCLKCGYSYTASHHLPFVQSCPRCTIKFGFDDIEGYLDKFYRGKKKK